MSRTRAQIQADIRSLNRTKDSYQTTLNKYKTSLNYAKNLVSNLNNSIKYLNLSIDYMKKGFVINGKTADGGKINTNKEQVQSILKTLNNKIIPSINSNINSLNSKINTINNKINNLNREYRQAEA